MMRASGATATVEAERVPISAAARAALAADPSLFERLVTGGDDYEVLAAIPPANLDRYLAASAEAGVATTAIGTATEGQGPPMFRVGGVERRYERGSYSHFRDER
jgi:thiamine-monophosphate kinase